MKTKIYVVSSKRSHALPFTKEQLRTFTFCVGDGEADAYRSAGCENVVETGKLVDSRNYGLEDAHRLGVNCIQLSDDLIKVTTNKYVTGKKETEVPLEVALRYLCKAGDHFPETLIGVPPTSNAFFAKKEFSRNTFCIGDTFLAKPTPIRFDTSLTLKEDYDLTLQHIVKMGGTIRGQRFLFHYRHYNNEGGAVSYRDDSEEQKNILYLKKKWKGMIRDNPKRKNEIKLYVR